MPSDSAPWINKSNDRNKIESTLLNLSQGSWDLYGAHLGPPGPRWAPCCPHEPCYLGYYMQGPGLRVTGYQEAF